MSSSPLRILHVAAPSRTGGLESVVVQLSAGLARCGHDVHVALVLSPGTDVDHPVVQAVRDSGVPLHQLVIGARDYLGERRAVRAIMRGMDAQVLHTHGYRADAIDGGVARSLHRAHVMTLHGFVGGSRRGRFYEWLQIQAARRADAVIAVSAPIVERLQTHGITRDVHLLRNAVAPSPSSLSREEARRALGLPAEGTLIGWVGRVSIEKGPDLFVQALSECPEAIGVIVGDGPALSQVQAMASQHGLIDRLHTPGLVPSASRYLSAFDVLALTSRTEGTPMILLESMWAGIPIVATAVGGVPQLLSSEQAYLCEASAESVAAALRRALTDLDGRRARAKAARVRVADEFSPDTWVENHVRLYRSSIGL